MSKIAGPTLSRLIVVGALVLAACGDEPAVPAAADGPDELARRGGAASTDWLALDDVRSPTHWLIERSSGRDVVGDDPRVAVLNDRLAAAERQFHESRRMLANRTAQLADVAAEEGAPVAPETILADLTFPVKGETRSWYGVLAQAYIVLRQGGRSHAEAVAALRAQYGEEAP